MTPEAVIDLVKNSGLQGRGGAGFGTGLKWSFMPKTTDKPKYLVCNADESEPGSFKDRILMERGPHQILEGILIAAFATGASKTFLYVRGEYAFPADQVERAVAEAYAKGYLGKNVLQDRVLLTTSSCSAARAPTSAAKRPACSNRSKARRASPARSRPSPRSTAPSACPRP